MRILVLNCGSSSVKFQIIETDEDKIAGDSDVTLVRGQVERIGGPAIVEIDFGSGRKLKRVEPLRDHQAAIESVLSLISSNQESWENHKQTSVQGKRGGGGLQTGKKSWKEAGLDAVGHRVVHGGERFTKSVVINDDVIAGIADCQELAPLHNPANLMGMQAVRDLFGDEMPQVAVFDTAFHSTIPEEAYLYALPYPLYRRHKIRRYGFHGTSHRYVSYRYRKLEGLTLQQVNLISLHLGNGCSACAIKDGESIDTSMGFTPLSGLVMGTRSGDIDPLLVEFLCQKEGLSIREVDTLLNKQSGLLGVSGLTHDMRELLAEARENNDRRARLAIAIFCRSIKKQIGAYLALLPECNSLVFTGGIGVNSKEIRREVLSGLESLGIELAPEEQECATTTRGEFHIQTPKSRLKVWVIPTNEELLIARDTFRCIADIPRRW